MPENIAGVPIDVWRERCANYGRRVWAIENLNARSVYAPMPVHGPWFDRLDNSRVTGVWSAYGHRFMGDGEGTESCLTCGALYQLLADASDPTRGEYVTASGGVPADCTHDTSRDHGYDITGDCPCIACDS